MADLSGVLRKTIDGLPKSTPPMRAKVYEKARAAIRRQVDAADPPLAPETVEARLNALEDAISRTEAHYAERDASAASSEAAAPASQPPVAPPSAAMPAQPTSEPRPQPAPAAPQAYQPDHEPRPDYPPVRHEPTAPPVSAAGAASAAAADPDGPHHPGDAPGYAGQHAGEPAPAARSGPTIVPPADSRARDDDRIPSDIRVDDDIPAADVSGPRHRAPSRRSGSGSGRALLTAACVILVVGGLGAVGWSYRDDIRALIAPGSSEIEEIAGAGQGEAQDNSGDAPAADADGPDKFTQRLMPDGSETDEGPAADEPNAFEEGTDIAAATPPSEVDNAVEGATPTIASEIGQNPETIGDVIGLDDDASGNEPDTAGDDAQNADEDETDVAAIDPQTTAVSDAPQDAVFYQERTDDEAGTRGSGNVVWSVVQEPPAEGEPAEPAIQARVTVPNNDIAMTMTIKRNTDPTLPASHVIEMEFDTPENFAGGEVANVQRLALKQTEQARGEPLIGVAGKISDNFFIIALNNLDQAMQNNLALLENQEWIDIPIAYSNGRRALMSVEKGEPGNRAFNEVLEAWRART